MRERSYNDELHPVRRVLAVLPPEAGAAGRDTRGMIRVQAQQGRAVAALAEPSTFVDELDLLLADTPELLVQALGCPYRVVVLPARDMSSASGRNSSTSRSGYPSRHYGDGLDLEHHRVTSDLPTALAKVRLLSAIRDAPVDGPKQSQTGSRAA